MCVAPYLSLSSEKGKYMFLKIKFFLSLLLTAFTVTLHAADKPTLTIYTYQSFASDWGPGLALKQAFEANTGCNVNFVTTTDSGTLLNRLRMEGKHSKADLVLGLDTNQIDSALKTNLFSEHQQTLDHLTLSGGWQDKTFFPISYGYFAFVYNKNRLKNPPKSLHALLQNQTLKVVYPDPRTSTVGRGLINWFNSVFTDKVPTAWQQLAQITRTVPPNWSTNYSLFLKGEADMAFSYTTSAAYHQHHQDGHSVVAALFSEGHIRQIEVMALLKNSKHPELARQFLRFIVQPESQKRIMLGNWMYPVIDVALPDSFKNLIHPTLIPDTEYKTDATQKAWIKTWLQATIRS